MRMAELILIIVLFWAVCWLLVQWLRAPSFCSVPPFSALPVSGQSRVGDFYVKHDGRAKSKIPVYIVEEHHEGKSLFQ